MATPTTYYAHGKLLITGEYAVLDGAKALAVPCKFGQRLEVTPSTHLNYLLWESIDVHGNIWFTAEFSPSFEVISSAQPEVAKRLQKILRALQAANPEFSKMAQGSKVKTVLEFDRHWGLGSSSTLIHLVSQWASINPYELLGNTFGGSGYDIACADASGPIVYQKSASSPKAETVPFLPEWHQQMFFVYLGQKQVSSAEIVSYAALPINREAFSTKVSVFTEQLIAAKNIFEFCTVLEAHEALVSKTLGYPTVKSTRFSTITGTFKSLGAWGGDFVLFVGDAQEIPKIKALGYSTILGWNDMLF